MVDLTGQRFGRLVVLRRGDRRSGAGNLYWMTRCDCGVEAERLGYDMLRGRTTSCGCYRRELRTTHGMSKTLAYRSYVERRRNSRKGKMDASDVAETIRKMERVAACVYCGSTHDLTMDHVIPLCRGGAHTPDNIVPACRSCNSRKHSHLLGEWLPESWGEVCILSQPAI
jgi:5-methylcytosine-specific restriction endonuclease McrA